MPSGNRRCRTGPRRRLAMAVRLAFLFGLIVLIGCQSAPPRGQAAQADLIQLLEQRGYRPNRGLAGIYEPGTLIQTTAPEDRGEPRPLPAPILFMWRADRFPEQTRGSRRSSCPTRPVAANGSP